MAKPAVPKKRRGKFVRTPVRRELGEILSKRGEEREKALLECEDLEAVVPMIPPEELFFTLREMDTDNIPLVLAHARTEQVQFLLDIELWQKDRVRPDRIARWIELLASCGETSLPRWLRGFEVADLALLLGQDVKVHLTEPDREPLQEIPGRAPFTLDGVHYISAPERLEPVVRAVLLSLREAEPGRYHRLVESLIRDVDSELEEHCYQERQKRLAERGFPEWEEAMQVYARLDVEDAGALPVRSGSPTGDSGDGPIVAPRYPVAFADAAPDLLARALRHIEDWDAREAVRAELAYLTNKVLVADGLELDRVDSFDLGLQKVASYTSIGLEVFCGYEEEKAAQVLRRSWMQSLFRVGWTRVRPPALLRRLASRSQGAPALSGFPAPGDPRRAPSPHSALVCGRRRVLDVQAVSDAVRSAAGRVRGREGRLPRPVSPQRRRAAARRPQGSPHPPRHREPQREYGLPHLSRKRLFGTGVSLRPDRADQPG
jgi:hypothetical protein